MNNFNDLDSNLCTYCGTCVAVCPTKSLEACNEKIRLVGKCNSCGLCFSICPGRYVSFNKLNRMFFGKESNDIIGHHKSIYVAHSKNPDIRQRGSSGGAVTALLLYALENKIIDGAIVVGMSEKEPWKYDIKIAKTPKEIKEASQSKYSLVPLNSILRKLENENGNFAVVGLPCHIHGIRNLQSIGWEPANKIKLLIGVFCGFNLHFSATDYLIKKTGTKKSDIKSLEYRGGPWPGGFQIKTKNDGEKFIKKFHYNFVNSIYSPKRCLLCIDLMNELADISVGDAWIDGIDEKGWSTVITRSDTGAALFEDAKNCNYIDYRKIPKEQLIKSHSHLIKYKKKGAFVRLQLNKVKPIYECTFPELSKKELLSEALFYYFIKIVSNRYVRKVIGMFPLKILGQIAAIYRRFISKNNN